MGKAGPIIGLIGAILIVIGWMISFSNVNQLEIRLMEVGTSMAEEGVDTGALNLNSILSLLCGILGIVGAFIGISGKKVGSVILLCVAIIFVIGTFIILAPEITFIVGIYQYTVLPIKVTSPLIIFDPYLMLLGGILGVRTPKWKDYL